MYVLEQIVGRDGSRWIVHRDKSLPSHAQNVRWRPTRACVLVVLVQAKAYKKCSQFLSKMEPTELRQLAEHMALWSAVSSAPNGDPGAPAIGIGMALRSQAVDSAYQSVLGQAGGRRNTRAAKQAAAEVTRLRHLKRFLAVLQLMLKASWCAPESRKRGCSV